MLTRVLFVLALICGTAATATAVETKVLSLGLADHEVSQGEIESGKMPPAPKFNTPGVAYALVAYAKKGDTVEITLMKDGEPVMHNVRELDADEDGVLVLAGKRGVPAGGWPEGDYQAALKITRDGKTLVDQTTDPVPFD
jgi:hypothetical protein